jgi:hypothetical protein
VTERFKVYISYIWVVVEILMWGLFIIGVGRLREPKLESGECS